MNKLTLIAIIGILGIFLVPILAQESLPWYYCDSSLSPFQNCKIISNFTPSEISAGSITCAQAEFDNKALLTFPLVVRINITAPEDYQIWRNDFSGFGWLAWPDQNYKVSLKCVQPESKTFFAENYTIPNNTLYCYHFTEEEENLFIVKPKSHNIVQICLIPNVALKPSNFEFTLELLSTYGPIWAEPKNVTQNGYTIIPLANLEVFTNFTEPIEIDALLYSEIFVKELPSERPFAIQFIDIKTNATEEQLNKGIKIRIYYDDTYIKSKGLDENNIRIYRFDEQNKKWILINSFVNTDKNYVESVWLKHFSLYGLFTSFYYPPAPKIEQKIYMPEYRIQYVYPQNITNITIEKPVERIIEKEVKPNITLPVCGNAICEVGETWQNCPEDCPKPKPEEILPTGAFVLSPLSMLAIIIGTIIVSVLIIIGLIKAGIIRVKK